MRAQNLRPKAYTKKNNHQPRYLPSSHFIHLNMNFLTSRITKNRSCFWLTQQVHAHGFLAASLAQSLLRFPLVIFLLMFSTPMLKRKLPAQ